MKYLKVLKARAKSLLVYATLIAFLIVPLLLISTACGYSVYVWQKFNDAGMKLTAFEALEYGASDIENWLRNRS